MAAPKGNKYAIGNNGGRPPVFKTPKELAKKVNEYFVYIQGKYHKKKIEITPKDAKKKSFVEEIIWDRPSEPATVTGLTLYLGFHSRASLDDYEKKDEFSYIIARARARVEHEYEKRLAGDKPNGSIFALKNMGWKDKQEIDQKNFNYNSEPLTPDKVRELEELKKNKF